MNFKLLVICAIGLGLLVIGFAGQYLLASTSVELWYQHASFLNSDETVQKSKALINKAAAAGYTGALFWDSHFNRMGSSDWDNKSDSRLREVMNYARGHHLKVIAIAAPFGWSNDVLGANPNWAEPQRVMGTQFQVGLDGKSLQIKNSLPPLVNGDFAAGQKAWFELGDPNIQVVANARPDGAALSIVDPAGNARIRQKLQVQPWRQYHLSFLYKAVGKHVGSPMMAIYDGANRQKTRFTLNLHAAHNWTQHDYVFNSADSTEIALYLGVWGGAQGTIQFANVQLEETGLVWLVRRDGAPFQLYNVSDPAKVYQPGVDYNEVTDPEMRPQRAFQDFWHTPPLITLPAGTHLKPGQIVAADYYAVTPLTNDNQVGMCMTDPGVFQWLAANAREMHEVIPNDSDVLLSYDEIRHANSCASCRAKGMTAGELLAWNFDKTYGIYHEALPDTSFWVWSDMFDPNHNAHENFMYVEGTLAGSWKGLPPNVSILNWNLDKLTESLTWFAGLHPEQPVAHQQMIAGYYDRPDAAAEARREVSAASGIPGVRGVMYSTWHNDYSQLQVFADAVRAAWPDYLKSVPNQ